MNLTLETSISSITVFFQGLISFFSPCVLPLIPLYIGYLSGSAKTVDEDGNILYKRSRVMRNTLFFVLGISFAFFLLGFGFTAIGQFFHNYRTWFTRIGGIIVVLFGLYQLGLFGSAALSKERRLRFQPDALAMNPLTALILGFTFSFAWTPCVGPALASVLLLAASSSSSFTGFLLLGIYTLGFVLPFLAVGLFTNALSAFLKKYRSAVKYTVKLGGILMVFIGVMMFTGWMNGISSYLSGSSSYSSAGENNGQNGTEAENNSSPEKASASSASSQTRTDDSANAPGQAGEAAPVPAPDFTLQDQYGNTHTFSDYKGKTVFLNFWATWCPPCRAEMPEIQEIYEEYGENASDVIILGIASPNVGREGSAEEIASFLTENHYTYPVVMDTDGMIAYYYGISAYPTTFMINADGNVFGYVPGQITKDIMKSIIDQTVNSTQ